MSGMAPKGTRDWSRSSIPGGWWLPEGITVADGKLCWEPRFDVSRRVEPTPDLLREFLEIAQFEKWKQWNTAILRFARKWGPLHLCYEHGWPVWHEQDRWNPPSGGPEFSVCLEDRLEDGRIAEPLWAWHAYSLRARDI